MPADVLFERRCDQGRPHKPLAIGTRGVADSPKVCSILQLRDCEVPTWCLRAIGPILFDERTNDRGIHPNLHQRLRDISPCIRAVPDEVRE